MKLLSELIGTMYIYDGLSPRLSKVLSEFDKNDVLDIAYCRFGPQALAVMERYHGTLTYVNSKEPKLDEIIQHNKSVMSAKKLEGQQLDNRVYSGKELVEYLRNFDRTKNYYIDDSVVGPDEVRTLCLCTILTLKYPEVTIDMKIYLARLFKYVRELWLHVREEHSSYNEVINSSMIRRDIVNGKVYIPCDGEYTENLLVESKNVLPVEFGTKVLANDAEWNNVLQSSIDTLLRVSKSRPIRMKDKIAIWEE